MNLLLSLFTVCCMAGGVSAADVAEVKGKPYTADSFRQYTKGLMKSYEAKKATQYDNFDHQFIILMSKNFPNIQATLEKTSAKTLDFDNPASIIEFDQQQEKQAQKMTKQSNLANLSRMFKKKSEEELALEDELDAKWYQTFNSFAKEGYYGYFKQRLKSDNTVSLCVNLDRQQLGLRSRASSLSIPYSQKKKLIREQWDVLLKLMPHESHFKHNYRIENFHFDCDVKMTVTEAGLDYLYNNSLVASFVNSAIADATPLKAKFL